MILRSLALNLRAGLRLALFMPLRAFDYRVSAADYAALMAFNALVWILAGHQVARGGAARSAVKRAATSRTSARRSSATRCRARIAERLQAR